MIGSPILGFTSIDYTTVDMALLRLGAVSVPLQTSAPVAQLRPIAAETEPVAIASSIDFLDDAVELALTGHLPERLVVFDYHAEVDDHREALEAAIDAAGRNSGRCRDFGRRARSRQRAAGPAGLRLRRRHRWRC